jgi:hypothetical protein
LPQPSGLLMQVKIKGSRPTTRDSVTTIADGTAGFPRAAFTAAESAPISGLQLISDFPNFRLTAG